MPLRRFSASFGGGGAATMSDANMPDAARLASEAIRLPAGQSALNRRTTGPTALIVAEGAVAVGTLDDNDTLTTGDGVLLEANATYSLVAETDSLSLLFTVSD